MRESVTINVTVQFNLLGSAAMFARVSEVDKT